MLKVRLTAKRLAGVVGVLVIAAVGSGCQYPISVNSAWVPGDVAPLGPTFAWMPGATAPTGNPEIDNPQTRNLIRKLVEEQLIAKGYQKATSGTASFRVGDRVGTEILGDPNTSYLDQYTKGTLVIYIVGDRTDQWTWRAWADARMNDSNPPDVRRQRLEQAVQMMFKDFPAYGQKRPGAKR